MNRTFQKLICLILTVLLCAGLSGCADAEVRERYRLGQAAMDAGQYAQAAEYFGPIADHRNSQKRLETIYREAMDLYEGGRCREAADIFAALAPYDVQDSGLMHRIAGAYACLYELDAAGAWALLEGADPAREETAAACELLRQWCFEDTLLIRPERIAEELRNGLVTPEVTNAATDRYMDIMVYPMTASLTDSVYAQYMVYCQNTFPDSFVQESGSYFTIRLDGQTYYVCNFHSLYGGLAIKIPRY